MENTTNQDNRPHVVIIGAGFAGLQVALQLGNQPVRITMIDRSNHHLFQPLLYQVATAGLSPADIASPIRSVLRSAKNTEVFLGEVCRIDAKNRSVSTTTGFQVSYDYLVVATGAGHSYFGHDEWAEFAPGLKTVADAVRIRRMILLAFEAAELETRPEVQQSLLTFVIVGGGPTGVELAGAIAELSRRALVDDFRHVNLDKTNIILLEAGPRILSAFPETLSKAATATLESLGVEVRCGCPVEKIDDTGVMVAGKLIPSRTVVWAAGVKASPAGAWLGTDTDRAGRVLVDPCLHPSGHPEIFVIGDTASVTQNGKTLPGIAPVALQEGQYVADAITKAVHGSPPPGPFAYFDKGNLATVGRSFAIVDLGYYSASGFFAWLLWLVIHIYYLISFRNRLLVMIQWGWAYLTFQRGARLIITDETAATAPGVPSQVQTPPRAQSTPTP